MIFAVPLKNSVESATSGWLGLCCGKLALASPSRLC
jgi:hypothetical protein